MEADISEKIEDLDLNVDDNDSYKYDSLSNISFEEFNDIENRNNPTEFNYSETNDKLYRDLDNDIKKVIEQYSESGKEDEKSYEKEDYNKLNISNENYSVKLQNDSTNFSCEKSDQNSFFYNNNNNVVVDENNIINVPLVNYTVRRNRIIEVPEIHIVEKIIPKIKIKEVIEKVPKYEVEYQEKIVEVPQTRIIEKKVKIDHIIENVKYVKKPEVTEYIIKEVPKYETVYLTKYVEVPQIKKTYKYVEVPEVKYINEYVEKVKIVECPIYKIKEVPKVHIKKVQKIKHVPGPIQYIDVPYRRVIHRPVYQTIQKIVEVPQIKEVIVEKPYIIEKEDDKNFIDIPVEYPVYYDVPKFVKIPGRVIPIKKERIIEKIVELPVAVPYETIKVVKVPQEKRIEVIKHVEVPYVVDEVVQVPKFVPVLSPPPIIVPVPRNETIDVQPIYEKASPRYIYDDPIIMPPLIDNSE